MATLVEYEGHSDVKLTRDMLSGALYILAPVTVRWGIHIGGRRVLTKMHENPAFKSIQVAIRAANKI